MDPNALPHDTPLPVTLCLTIVYMIQHIPFKKESCFLFILSLLCRYQALKDSCLPSIFIQEVTFPLLQYRGGGGGGE